MTEQEYRALPGIRRSDLFLLKQSPAYFKYATENPKPPTPALTFGALFHTFLLEPEKVQHEFAIAPNVDRRTKVGKEAYALFEAQLDGKTVVTQDMVEQAAAMAASVRANPMAARLLQGEKETPFLWTDELTEEPCKVRADISLRIGEKPYLVDVKSARCAQTQEFVRDALKYGYHLQAAMYTEGAEKVTGEKHGFIFLVCETEPPYLVNVLACTDAFITSGYDLFRELIGTLHECKTTGDWYGLLGKTPQINTCQLPPWMLEEKE